MVITTTSLVQLPFSQGQERTFGRRILVAGSTDSQLVIDYVVCSKMRLKYVTKRLANSVI